MNSTVSEHQNPPDQRYYHFAPGNILQNMYIKHRLSKYARPSMKFIELGPGNGKISNILLSKNLRGAGYDLSDVACANNRIENADYINSGMYKVENSNFFDIPNTDKVDLIISSHVLEHLSSNDLELFFEKCKSLLNANGKIISLVPAGMKYWGFEDETVGHYRRFEFSDFEKISRRHHFNIDDIAGLTYPLSNILFEISNSLLKKNESWKKKLSKQEQTVLSSSGVRNIKYKTYFPSYFRYFINELTLYPFFIFQLMSRKNPSSINIYCELSCSQ